MRVRSTARLAAAALVAAAALAAAPAWAATCDPGSVTTDAGIAALACTANIPGGNGGNVTAAEMDANAVFGTTGWTDLGKVDLPGTGGGLLEISFDADRLTGTWKLAAGYAFDPLGSYALVLKAGAPGNPNGNNGKPKKSLVSTVAEGGGPVYNVAYLLDVSKTSGTWSTADLVNNGGQVPGLSNVTLFGSVAPIPLPAAAWLLIGGIAALGATGRRRRPAAS